MTTQTQTDLAALVRAANDLLEAGEPGNISTDEHAGYTGYKPQFIIDAMNDVFGIGQWGFEEVSSEIVPTGDKGSLLAVAQVKVWLEGVRGAPVGWGQNRVTRGDLGDARKGAQTDAIKKALSYFSIGNRAYQGLLDAGNNGHQPVATTKPYQPVDPAHISHMQEVNRRRVEGPQTTLKNGDGSPVVIPSKRAQPQSVALTRGDLYTRGEKMGLWSRTSPEKFYAWASAVAGGRPQSKANWDMTLEEMGEMAQQLYEQVPATVSGAN